MDVKGQDDIGLPPKHPGTPSLSLPPSTPPCPAPPADEWRGRFIKHDVLGKGASATVFRATERKTGEQVAVKAIDISPQQPLANIQEEIHILRALKHPRIIQIRESHVEESRAYIITRWFPHELGRYISGCEKPMHTLFIQSILYQILEGVSYCHRNGVAHLDLKPQNIVIDMAGEVRIIDFGCAMVMPEKDVKHGGEYVTLWYRAPEIMLSGVFGLAADIWSIGCIFAEMFNGFALFRGDYHIDQLFRISRTLGPLPPSLAQLSAPTQCFGDSLGKAPPLNKTFKEMIPRISDSGAALMSVRIFYFIFFVENVFYFASPPTPTHPHSTENV
jgi:negative regulator of PHO system